MNEHRDIPNYIGVKDASKILRISEQHVRRLLADEKLTGHKVSGSWVLTEDDVSKFALELGTLVEAPIKKEPISSRLNILSFFSGAMGLDLGMESAGLKTLLTCESDKWSRETISRNRPELPVLGDIWKHDADSILHASGLRAGEVDVISGGPPCQAFSTAGSRRSFEDERGNVFLHFIDLAIQLQPRYFVIENVRGLLSAALRHRPWEERGEGFAPLNESERPGGALRYILSKLQEGGFEVSFNLYNSANYGAPQTRERVIMICTRDGQKVPYLPPTHSNDPNYGLPRWVTFADAVAGLNPSHAESLSFPESRLKYYKLLGPGQYWKNLPEDLQKEALGKSYYSGGGKTGFLRRLAWDKPSPTLVTHPAMPATDLAHPEEMRPLSIQEYKRIQGFPDSWELQGPLIQRYKQVGNAVPIPLGRAVGKQILAHSQGQIELPPQGFEFSRYRKTSDLHFTASMEPLF